MKKASFELGIGRSALEQLLYEGVRHLSCASQVQDKVDRVPRNPDWKQIKVQIYRLGNKERQAATRLLNVFESLNLQHADADQICARGTKWNHTPKCGRKCRALLARVLEYFGRELGLG
jgi:hypothetical protein